MTGSWSKLHRRKANIRNNDETILQNRWMNKPIVLQQKDYYKWRIFAVCQNRAQLCQVMRHTHCIAFGCFSGNQCGTLMSKSFIRMPVLSICKLNCLKSTNFALVTVYEPKVDEISKFLKWLEVEVLQQVIANWPPEMITSDVRQRCQKTIWRLRNQ